MEMLCAQNLSVSIGDTVILDDLTVSIPQGKRTAIIGPNGSGKSTLLKALCGLLRYRRGKVFLAEREIHTLQRRVLAKKMAILPQSLQVPGDLTVRDLVEHGRFPHRNWRQINREEDRKSIAWAMEKTGIMEMKERLISTLSGGERQRAWIAMALAQKPEILLLDEPTTYLDVCHQLEVMQLLSRLNQENGLSVVMVLHDLNHAIQFADHVVVVKKGSIVAQGMPQEVLTISLLAEVFSIRAEVFRDRQGRPVFLPLASLNL